jgi:hypothetical protein
MMLATTAARTGGVCMACKQGIRKSLENSKVYYQQQRQPDPFRDFWTSLVRRVHDESAGFDSLSPSEQTSYAVGVLEGEVYNGGIHQFFFNSSGSYYREALRGLEELGAMRCHALLLAAREEWFPAGDPPRDTAARRVILPSPSRDLDWIDKEFWTDPDKLGEKLRKYAVDHNLV